MNAHNPPVRQFVPDWSEDVAPLNWAHAPSPFAWSVMCFGGQNPRTGQDQPQLEVNFPKRTRPNGHGIGIEGILHRANDYAKMQHRSHVAVRDGDGRVIYAGPVMGENDMTAADEPQHNRRQVVDRRSQERIVRDRRMAVRRNCQEWSK